MTPPCEERKPVPLRPVTDGEPPRCWIVPSSHPHQPWEDALPEVLRLSEEPQETDYIVVIGGDGAMLHSIQEYSWANKPFVGLNAGTRGFLMNEVADTGSLDLLFKSVYVEQLWMVEADVLTDEGPHRVYGFNDIWVERTQGQTLKMRVTVDGLRHTPLIVGDGMLFSTPQGSTGYNQALRGKVLLPEVPVLQMTPMSCVVNKAPFGSLLFCYNSEICLEFEEQEKRPARLFYDGILFQKGPVRSFTVRKSARTVCLGFDDRYALKTRVIGWQFQS